MDLNGHKITCELCRGDGSIYSLSIFAPLREWRESLGITQAEAAEAAGIADNTQVSRFENGRFTFGETRLRKLVQFYTDRESKRADAG